MSDVTSKCYRGTGAGRTIDSLGQGSGVCVLPECATVADSAGLALRILLVLPWFLQLVDLDGPLGHVTQHGAPPPSCWTLESLPLWTAVYQSGDHIYPGNTHSQQQKWSSMVWCINTGSLKKKKKLTPVWTEPVESTKKAKCKTSRKNRLQSWERDTPTEILFK